MDEVAAPVAVPSKVQLIGFTHLVCGILNSLTLLSLALYAVVFSLPTFGFSLLACCPMVVLAPIAGLEIYSGARHVGKNHRGLRAPRMTGVAQLLGVMGCGFYSFVGGVLTLVFLSDPEVAAYYEARAAE